MSFGKRIKILRDETNLERQQLADAVGITYHALAKYETDERQPDFETVSKLADYFNVSIDYLLGRTDIKNTDDGVQHVNDDEALEYLDELHKRPEMKVLFDVSRKATKEDIETTIAIIEALKNKGGNSDE